MEDSIRASSSPVSSFLSPRTGCPRTSPSPKAAPRATPSPKTAHSPAESPTESPEVLSPELLGEVADLLRDIVYDRVRPDIRPAGTAVEPGWLRAAVEEQYGLLGAALDERIEPR